MSNFLLRLLGLEPKIISPIPDSKRIPQSTKFVSPLTESTLAQRPAATPMPTPMPNQFGGGNETAYIQPDLFNALMALKASEEERSNIAELTGQESSYGYSGPHISEKEESYGPVHINIAAGRINPATGKKFTKTEAEDIQTAIEYALSEYRKRQGLGAWNPGAYDFYQKEIPERAKKKVYKKG